MRVKQMQNSGKTYDARGKAAIEWAYLRAYITKQNFKRDKRAIPSQVDTRLDATSRRSEGGE